MNPNCSGVKPERVDEIERQDRRDHLRRDVREQAGQAEQQHRPVDAGPEAANAAPAARQDSADVLSLIHDARLAIGPPASIRHRTAAAARPPGDGSRPPETRHAETSITREFRPGNGGNCSGFRPPGGIREGAERALVPSSKSRCRTLGRRDAEVMRNRRCGAGSGHGRAPHARRRRRRERAARRAGASARRACGSTSCPQGRGRTTSHRGVAGRSGTRRRAPESSDRRVTERSGTPRRAPESSGGWIRRPATSSRWSSAQGSAPHGRHRRAGRRRLGDRRRPQRNRPRRSRHARGQAVPAPGLERVREPEHGDVRPARPALVHGAERHLGPPRPAQRCAARLHRAGRERPVRDRDDARRPGLVLLARRELHRPDRPRHGRRRSSARPRKREEHGGSGPTPAGGSG